MRRIQVITLFPDMFKGVLGASMLYKATASGVVEFKLVNLRDFGLGPRRQVDDKPYGGGEGMLLMIEPLVAAIEAAKQVSPESRVILPTPRGELFKQSVAQSLADQTNDLIFVCPRYEGYDERLVNYVDESYRLGNFVLTGGELPAMVMIDAVVRLLPGVLGGESSAINESFSDDLNVEYPQYTRPLEFRGQKVPPVLLSGHHAEVEAWRAKHAGKLVD